MTGCTDDTFTFSFSFVELLLCINSVTYFRFPFHLGNFGVYFILMSVIHYDAINRFAFSFCFIKNFLHSRVRDAVYLSSVKSRDDDAINLSVL